MLPILWYLRSHSTAVKHLVFRGWWFPTFWSNVSSSSRRINQSMNSTQIPWHLKTETVHSFKTSGLSNPATWHNNPGNLNPLVIQLLGQSSQGLANLICRTYTFLSGVQHVNGIYFWETTQSNLSSQ
jgi:hypothetical protein